MSTYKVEYFENGTDVFKRYKNFTDTLNSDELLIFCEKKSNTKSNFFGTACRVKMGTERVKLMKDLYNRKVQIKVEQDDFYSKNVTEWSKRISYYESNKIDASTLEDAVLLEILETSSANSTIKSILELNNKLADWMNTGVSAMEKWKFTEINYEYQEYYLRPNYNKVNGFPNAEITFKPLIPIHIFNNIRGMDGYKPVEKTLNPVGTNILINLVANIDDIVLGITDTIVRATPNRVDDYVWAWFKSYMEENLFPIIKTIYGKIKEIAKSILDFIQKLSSVLKNEVRAELAKLNSFLCGLINGIISFLQSILAIVSFVVGNIPFLELEKISPNAIAEHQEKLEFIEEMVDLISENASQIFDGIKSSILTFGDDMYKFTYNIAQKIKGYSEYFWAYFVGAVAFELILDAVLAFFTGGASIAAEVTSKISRLATKAEQLASKGIKLSTQVGKKVAQTASDLITWLKIQIAELIDAIKNGKLVEWLKEKILSLFEGSLDNIASASVDDLIKKYGKEFIEKGKVRFRQDFESKLYHIGKDADSFSNSMQWKRDFLSKTHKISEEAYLRLRKMQYINFEKGKIAEQIFEKLYGGIKQTESIVTAYTKRFIDNVANNTAKEIKSGFIKNTKAFQKQVKKDIDILARKLDDDIKEVEWHIMEDIDEKALDFIVDEIKRVEKATNVNVKSKFKIILYK